MQIMFANFCISDLHHLLRHVCGSCAVESGGRDENFVDVPRIGTVLEGQFG